MKLLTKPTLWDWKYIAFILMIISFIQPLAAQQKLPTIKATSRIVDVKDGEVYQKGRWNLSPENKPDIYFALEPVHEKKITFYTNIDSISFNIIPGRNYDFIILLNSKDTCYTQISTIRPVKKTELNTVSLNYIEPELLKQDFTFFREELERKHAGLYRYKSKALLDKLFDSCFAALNRPMPQLEFAKSIMFVISSIEDGHTASNLPRLLMNYYGENEKMFPVHVFFINKKAYVLCSRIKELPAETEILSIDNKPISQIKKELFQYLPSDGKIETKKNQTLNNGAFTFLYNWIFGNKNSFIVKYKTKQGEIKTTNIHAEYVKDFECDNGNDLNIKKDLQLDFPNENTALLTIKTFDDNRLAGKQDFRDFLATSFKEIISKRISNLIIDLRGNAGGADKYGALLYSYLTYKPFKYFYSIESTTSKISLKEDSLLGIQQPQNNSFNGKVLFLINGLCFSTTADFCSIAKSNNRGKFIGEETGGGYYGNTSGQTTTTELPNSKISIKIPKFKYLNDVVKAKDNDRGIIPNYTILPTIDEVMLHKDVQLNFALKLAKGK
ncbi:S41 family peptidase [Flavihumibacter fluvii]|uniref:S41 family peptidase n=1 Tax=Flavihumibacter fluvii TaxID=2838157 RepID=UPI001BDE2A33|nr:S41 family peptidase [Flavihumibacter fluvii]ULQ51749.1 S41 family peptidase [Flavihumibacter fluvii]